MTSAPQEYIEFQNRLATALNLPAGSALTPEQQLQAVQTLYAGKGEVVLPPIPEVKLSVEEQSAAIQRAFDLRQLRDC